MAAILLIDDDAQLRDVLRLMLSSLGHEVEEAANGVEGLAAYQRRHFDVVFSDLFMPEKEGLETIRELRKLAPDARIIAMTGGGGQGKPDFLRIAASLGADETLSKPFDLQLLRETLAKVIRA